MNMFSIFDLFLSPLILLLIGFLLNRNLQKNRSKLDSFIEDFKIRQSSIQAEKINAFRKILFVLFDIMHSKDKPKEEQIATEKKLRRISLLFFLYGDDNTIYKYLEFRKCILYEENNAKSMVLIGELIVLMRKDVGYLATDLDKDDVLNLILNDWEKVKGKYKN